MTRLTYPHSRSNVDLNRLRCILVVGTVLWTKMDRRCSPLGLMLIYRLFLILDQCLRLFRLKPDQGTMLTLILLNLPLHLINFAWTGSLVILSPQRLSVLMVIVQLRKEMICWCLRRKLFPVQGSIVLRVTRLPPRRGTPDTRSPLCTSVARLAPSLDRIPG